MIKQKKGRAISFISKFLETVNNYLFPILKTVVLLFVIGFVVFLTLSWNFDKADRVFHFLEVSLWPIIFIVFVFLFKNEIGDLLIKGFQIIFPNGYGLKTGDTIPTQEDSQEETESKNIVDEDLTKEYEVKINQLGNSLQQLKTELANTQIYLDFERVYRIIFGSQIDLLKRLRSSLPNGELSSRTVFFFVLTQRLNPTLVNWDFSQYLNFLLTNELVYFSNNNYFITDKGKGFLAYYELLNLPVKNL